MRILLTGSTGNIGSQAFDALLRDGHTVRCLVRRMSDAQRLRRRGAPGKVEVLLGDVRDATLVREAVVGQDVVVHLAALLPPQSDLNPELAYSINVEGTRTVLQALQDQPRPARLIYTSSIALFGNTQDQPPPRRVGDPLHPLDPYSKQKVICEDLVRESGLDWAILRFTAVPRFDESLNPERLRAMFAINLDDRMEFLHPDDAGLALLQAVRSPDIWGKTLLIAGGPACQITMREYYQSYLDAVGLGTFPPEAYSRESYHLDWYDTTESQALLDFQRHGVKDLQRDLARHYRWHRLGAQLVRPVLRQALLTFSPVYRSRGRAVPAVTQ